MAYALDRLGDIARSLDAMQKECMFTLALKIVDDTCKMDEYERSVFMQLFDAMSSYESEFFEPLVFTLISEGRSNPTAQIYAQIKPHRKAGMDYIGRPNMKAFKAYVRECLS